MARTPRPHPSRGRATRLRTVVVLTVLLGACTGSPSGSESARRMPTGVPNVLIIVTDDQRQGLGAMPATRRLFERGGIRYTEAFATTPLCCPSRASIMTGRYAHNHGVETNFEAGELDQSTTIQAYLHEEGYLTALFGKFFNHWDMSKRPEYFDTWAISGADQESTYYRRGEWNIDGNVDRIPKYATTFIEQQALDFLRDADENDDARPWLMWLNTTAPHAPFRSEPAHAGDPVRRWEGNPAVFERDRSDKSAYVRRARCDIVCGRTIRRRQLRTLMSVDDMIEAVFDGAQELGEETQTLAFFISDNGLHWGEHGLRDKRKPYTESIRVPMLMRWPGAVRAGATDERLVANIDIAPTILEAAEIEPDASTPLDGRSLLDHSWKRKRILTEYWRAPDGGKNATWASIRTSTSQYVQYYGIKGNVAGREYYDLVEDPFQLRNLLGDRDRANDPDVRGRAARLERLRRCAGARCP